jgi:hypothetical protein
MGGAPRHGSAFSLDAMSVRDFTKIAGLLVPGCLFIAVCALPYYSDRLSLIEEGLPLAHIVAKEKLNIFDYVDTDFMRAQAIVFSHGKPVGWIYAPMFGLPRYVPFLKPRDFDVSSPEQPDPGRRSTCRRWPVNTTRLGASPVRRCGPSGSRWAPCRTSRQTWALTCGLPSTAGSRSLKAAIILILKRSRSSSLAECRTGCAGRARGTWRYPRRRRRTSRRASRAPWTARAATSTCATWCAGDGDGPGADQDHSPGGEDSSRSRSSRRIQDQSRQPERSHSRRSDARNASRHGQAHPSVPLDRPGRSRAGLPGQRSLPSRKADRVGSTRRLLRGRPRLVGRFAFIAAINSRIARGSFFRIAYTLDTASI